MFPGVLNASILGRAAAGGFASYHVHDVRDFADNKHRKVDDRPFGGGPGMVIMCQPLYDCVQAVERLDPTGGATRILLTPQGEPLHRPSPITGVAHYSRGRFIQRHLPILRYMIVRAKPRGHPPTEPAN